jgi:putative ABC transport system ATP-binding protein
LLADEPTGNLDSRTKVEIMRLLVELNERRGITIAMVTHEPEMAEYVQRVISFRDGRILTESGPHSLHPSAPPGQRPVSP